VAEATTGGLVAVGRGADKGRKTAFELCHAAVYNILVFSVAMFHTGRSEQMQGDLLNPMKLVAVYVTIATLPTFLHLLSVNQP
jgi:hypothetical protein